MTSAINLLKPVLEIDSRISIANEKLSEYGVKKGGVEILPQEVSSSNYSTNQVTLSFVPNSLDTIIAKDIPFTITFNCSVTADAGLSGFVLDPSVFFAIRSFSLQRIVQTINITINGQTVTFQPYLLIPILERFTKSPEFQRMNLSNTAVMPDFLQNYSDHYIGGARVEGAVMNPLLGFGQGSGQGYGEPRGTFQLNNLVNPSVGQGNSGTATFSITLHDSLLHPLLSPGDNSVPGLTNMSRIEFTVVFVQDIMKSLFSQCDTAGGTFTAPGNITAYSINMTNVTAPTFGITQITPGRTVSIPRNAVYSFPQITIQPFNIGTVNSGASLTFTTGNYPLLTYPKRIYGYAMEDPNTSTITSTNTFGKLTNVQFIFDGKSGVLASASNLQEWMLLHRDSGGNLTYNMYDNLTGGAIAADVTKTLLLTDGDAAPGISKQVNFQIGFTITNINLLRNINYIFYIITINDAIATIGDGTMQLPNILINRGDVERVSQTPANQAEVSKTSHSWWGGARAAIQRFIPYSARGAGLIGGLIGGGNDVTPMRHNDDDDDVERTSDPSNYDARYFQRKSGTPRGMFGGMGVSKHDLQQRYYH
jgi:hypothetical protein